MTGAETATAFDAVVLVAGRDPADDLHRELVARRDQWADRGIAGVTRIGDALAPATIAHAVHSGHLYARNLDRAVDSDAVPFLRELP
jgi:dimethylamine/trimethylamine dehydrogenase